uniref:NADH-ubiquinone oxidoreductase chain 5 n=1 Tax=Metacrangonyx spinicaudatus TaxID=1199190 RepID=K7ZVP4_9CRUS|nr:NADH dehydrogenase subunit 5 [Metacrangonyx spinicaudatus]CCI69427.1 NADH dehydrogenase subunit 5 [Metacrangonyx spinicaudatus]
MKMKESIYYVFMNVMFFMSICSFLLFMKLTMNDKSLFLEWELFFFNGASIIFLMMFDWMSTMFMFTVSLISSVICGYSKYYMEGDKFYRRFMIVLMLFVSSMILLILSPNLISLLLGWDGLGLSSYILVVYYQNEYACNSGMLTVLSNRVGDAMILISICLMYCHNSWNFLLESSSSKLMLILLVVGAMTKSAQIPFSAWLPAAMAAPTPVSALVHSSTLVTAGVFLLIRFYPCFFNKVIYILLLIMGSLTMVMSGWMANFEMDMKKIIALSTLSQLGLMMMIVSLGAPELAFFHLVTHAMFKSTIFMCAGVMIHNMAGSQDLRLTNNFFISGPFLGLFFAVSNMSLCGFPFLAGYFSKDLLLENILSFNMNFFFHFMSMIGTGLTVSYSLRAMYYMSDSSSKVSLGGLNEMSLYLLKIMIIMMFMSVFIGFIFSWMCLPMGFLFLNLSDFLKFYIMIIMVISFFMSYIYSKKNNFNYKFKVSILQKGSHLMMYLPYVSSQSISSEVLKESYSFNKMIDLGWLEYFLGMNLYNKFNDLNKWLIFSQLTKFLKMFMISLFVSITILMNFV